MKPTLRPSKRPKPHLLNSHKLQSNKKPMAVRTGQRKTRTRTSGLVLLAALVTPVAGSVLAMIDRGWLEASPLRTFTFAKHEPLIIRYAYFSPPRIRMPAESHSIDQQTTMRPPVAEPLLHSPDRQAEPDEATRLNRMASLHALSKEGRNRALLAKPEYEDKVSPTPVLTKTTQLEEPVSDDNRSTQDPVTDHITTTDTGYQLASITVLSGDTFSDIATGLGIPKTDVSMLLKVNDMSEKLNKLHPGEQLFFEMDEHGKLNALSYEIDREHRMRATRHGDEFRAKKESLGFDKRLMQAAGRIESSIFLAASAAGVSDALIMQVADIFKWDVDFARDIQPGDSFKIVYEGLFSGDELKRTGRVLAVELTSRHTTRRAYYYKRDGYKGAYYTEAGRSMEKQFLRNPLEVVRITSKFDLSRRHPVLNKIRAHKGVDYGAATGTPIFATGKGKVTFKGERGGYGKTVILQHGRKYSTLYAHMSRFAKGLRLGDHVEQGQVIGYVGKTGLATGPHLHYEFRINGEHKDPQTVDFPGAESLPETEIATFRAHSQQPRYVLNALELPIVALAN